MQAPAREASDRKRCGNSSLLLRAKAPGNDREGAADAPKNRREAVCLPRTTEASTTKIRQELKP